MTVRRVTAFWMVSALLAWAQEPTATLLQRLEKLEQQMARQEAQIREQQATIQQLQQQLQQGGITVPKAEVAAMVKDEVRAAVKQAPTPGAVRLAPHIASITLTGDLRLRYERRDSDDQDKSSRDRFRTRFRAGGIWKSPDEAWEVGAGLASGDETPTTTNDTWSEEEPFETGDIRLDYAYGRHVQGPFTLTLGQQKSPFRGSWVLFDTDVRPAGFTAQAATKQGWFATAGYYDVYNAGNNVAELLGGQLGYAGTWRCYDLTAATSLFRFGDAMLRPGDSDWFGVDTTGDGKPDNGGAGKDNQTAYWSPADPGYGVDIADLYVSLGLPIRDQIKLTPYGHYWVNVGAAGGAGEGILGPQSGIDPEDANQGWVTGIELKAWKVKLGYAYTQVGADSTFAPLVESTMGSGLDLVDVKAHQLQASYALTKNLSLTGTAYFVSALDRDNDPGDVTQFIIDLDYRF